MSSSTNPDFLRDNQYRETGNLQARMDLHGQFSTSREPFWRWVFERLEVLPAGAKVLEVGCGVGAFWLANSDRIPAGWRLTMTDLSAGMVAAAEQAFEKAAIKADFQVADVRALPFESSTFDAAVANFMLYHLPDRRQALSEIARILKPGGWLFAATNGSRHLREIRDLEARFGIETLFGSTSSAQAFGLQNGSQQLQAVFDHVVVERHEDSLVVPSAEPIVRHIRSKLAKPELAQRKLDAVAAHLAKIIAGQGHFAVTKASGLFIARKP